VHDQHASCMLSGAQLFHTRGVTILLKHGIALIRLEQSETLSVVTCLLLNAEAFF
jgi:hypothetical protein